MRFISGMNAISEKNPCQMQFISRLNAISEKNPCQMRFISGMNAISVKKSMPNAVHKPVKAPWKRKPRANGRSSNKKVKNSFEKIDLKLA